MVAEKVNSQKWLCISQSDILLGNDRRACDKGKQNVTTNLNLMYLFI